MYVLNLWYHFSFNDEISKILTVKIKKAIKLGKIKMGKHKN